MIYRYAQEIRNIIYDEKIQESELNEIVDSKNAPYGAILLFARHIVQNGAHDGVR